MSRQAEDIRKLSELIRGISIAMLTTVEQDGTLRSRPMASRQVEDDCNLWFFTQESSPKVDEVRHDRHVNLSYADPKDDRYVSISGTARVVHDRQKAKELWTEEEDIWYPQGLEDPELALLKVSVKQAQYWDRSSGAMKALASAAMYPGENKKLDLDRK